MYVSILGRQPELSVAELEKVFGYKNIKLASSQAVIININEPPDISNLGGSIKIGQVIDEISFNRDWNKSVQHLINYYLTKLEKTDSKITLGISYYGVGLNERDIQKIGILIKQKLKRKNVSLRLIPNTTKALSSAVSHHNKLGLSANKIELLIIKTDSKEILIAESIGSQNITAYAKRDQQRPKRDAFVGMLPPKLAQIMINLATGQMEYGRWNMEGGENAIANNQILNSSSYTILDPFCGTGVLLQEAALMGFSIIGTDLSEKMIDYSKENIKWLENKYNININKTLKPGDATKTRWPERINAVVSETYLGQPFTAPPSQSKLIDVVGNCNHIISEFLKNLQPQIDSNTPVCIAVPAWRNQQGDFTHISLIETVARLGYRPYEFHHVSKNKMIYFRENQIVAREILVLNKI